MSNELALLSNKYLILDNMKIVNGADCTTWYTNIGLKECTVGEFIYELLAFPKYNGLITISQDNKRHYLTNEAYYKLYQWLRWTYCSGSIIGNEWLFKVINAPVNEICYICGTFDCWDYEIVVKEEFIRR